MKKENQNQTNQMFNNQKRNAMKHEKQNQTEKNQISKNQKLTIMKETKNEITSITTLLNQNDGTIMKATKSECATITALLNQIDANDWLRTNIEKILQDQRQEIHANQIINALRIGIQFKNGCLNIGALAPMQSGKTDTVFFLCNYVLPSIGFLEECEHAGFVTSMRDLGLYEQNKATLEKKDAYDYVNGAYMTSKIIVFKIDEFFKKPNPYKAVLDSNIKLVVRDEDSFGAGTASTFDHGFFNKLRIRLPKIPLLSVSATPFDILDAKDKGYDVEIVTGERPEAYHGITEMLNANMIDNLPNNFSVFEKCGPRKDDLKLNSIVEEYTEHLLTYNSGVGIVRVKNSAQAIRLRMMVDSIYSGLLDCLFIGSNRECDYTIQQGIEEVRSRVITQKKRVFLIIVGALTAGKDFKKLKEYIRFGIETRERQLANAAQGLPGRLCGYHSNRTFKLLACVALLKKYAAFEKDTNVFFNQDWRRGIFNSNVFELTTQSILLNKTAYGNVISIERIDKYSKSQLTIPSVKKVLIGKLGIDVYKKLLAAFNWKKYDRNKGGKGFRINDKTGKTTVRAASSYKTENGKNRVYSIMENVTSKSDFGSVMFKKKVYKYGILISNYPASHENNTMGFCGIMLVEAGKKVYRQQEIAIENEAMYAA